MPVRLTTVELEAELVGPELCVPELCEAVVSEDAFVEELVPVAVLAAVPVAGAPVVEVEAPPEAGGAVDDPTDDEAPDDALAGDVDGASGAEHAPAPRDQAHEAMRTTRRSRRIHPRYHASIGLHRRAVNGDLSASAIAPDELVHEPDEASHPLRLDGVVERRADAPDASMAPRPSMSLFLASSTNRASSSSVGRRKTTFITERLPTSTGHL